MCGAEGVVEIWLTSEDLGTYGVQNTLIRDAASFM